MKKARLVLTGCLMLLALIMLIGGFYGTPTALAAESNETPAAVASEYSEYNETPKALETN